jgi:dTDP-4-dehydrorhamnose 3,5-epimerase-like enzyme
LSGVHLPEARDRFATLQRLVVGDLSLVRLLDLNTHADPRGKLTAIEGESDIPFEIRRIFYVYGVSEGAQRAGHAHPDTEQCLVAVSGSLDVEVKDLEETRTFRLDDPGKGLYVPSMLWVSLLDFSAGAVCLAAASTHYAPGDVVRDWEQYRRMGSAGTVRAT